MYGKIFESIYDGTLAEDWRALITFQQLIVLADADGVTDITLRALHRRTGIPEDILRAGIASLESPDPQSRSAEEDGKRIVRLDEHRDWGWRIVNHKHYKNLNNSDTKREQNRERQRRWRERQRNEDNVSVTRRNADNALSRYKDKDKDKDSKRECVFADAVPAAWQPPDGLNLVAWADFETHRRTIRKPLSDLARTKAANLLLPLTPEQQQACVDYSIAGRYTGLFPERQARPSTGREGAEQAWDTVIGLLKRHGKAAGWQEIPDEYKTAIRAMGGWSRIADIANDFQLAQCRKDFLAAYQGRAAA